MAAEVNIRMVLECTGLGGGTVSLPPTKFTETRIPDDYRRIDAVISTTASLVSTLANIASADILGMGLVARGGGVFFNTISTNISTSGQMVLENQPLYMSFLSENSCKLAYKGIAAGSAITLVYYGVVA